MRSKFLLGLVVMMLMAVPAMAAPIQFTFSGSAAGALGPNDVDVDYALTFFTDTTALRSGTFVPTGQSVDYYGALGAKAVLTFYDITTGLATGTSTFYTDSLVNTFYVAFSPAQTALGVPYDATFAYGVYDPALFSDPSSFGMGFDGISIEPAPVTASFMTTPGASFVTSNYMLAIAMAFTTGNLLALESPLMVEVPNPDYIPGVPDTGPATLWVNSPMTVSTTPVPEPTMLMLFGAGLLGLGVFRKKM